MRSSFYFRCFVVAVSFPLAVGSFAQEEMSQTQLRHPLKSNWKIGGAIGLGVSSQKAYVGKWAGEWYVPEVSYSYNLSLSRRIRNQLWINSGVSFEYYRFRSKAYVHSGTSTYYSQGPNGLTPNTYSFTDDFERYSDRVNGYISFPLDVEYASENKMGMYARVGLRLSIPLMSDFQNRRAESNNSMYSEEDINVIGDYSQATIFGNYAFGLQLNSGRTQGTLGLAYSHGLFRKKNGSPMALRVELGIRAHLFKAVKNQMKADVIPKKRREYVYLEVLGNRLFYSLNFEHSIISRRMFRWNARAGGALHQRGEVLEKLGILGSSFVIGQNHAFEFGLNMQFYEKGQLKNDIAFAPMFGYRFEPEGNFFGRVIYTPVSYQSLKYYCSFLNCAEHYGAVSIGVRF